MKVEKSIKIVAVPEKIWPFLVDPKKIPMWFDSFKKCEVISKKKTGIGTTFYVEEKVPGPLRKINFKSTVWDDNKALTLKMTSGKNISGYEINWQLQKDQSGTKFHFIEDVDMPFGPIGKIIGLLGQNTANKMVENMLIKLKSLSEK